MVALLMLLFCPGDSLYVFQSGTPCPCQFNTTGIGRQPMHDIYMSYQRACRFRYCLYT